MLPFTPKSFFNLTAHSSNVSVNYCTTIVSCISTIKAQFATNHLISHNSRRFQSTTTTNGSNTKPMRKYFRGLQVRLKNFMGARFQPSNSQNVKADHWKQWLKRRMVDGREHWRVRLVKKTEAELQEQMPDGLFQRMHFYFKRYWYIALPVHTVCCLLWFGGLYLAVQSGVDVVLLLEKMHLPESWVQKVRELPKTAGSLAAALLLYKVFTPLRYACTLFGIRIVYKRLKNFGYLRTARQLQYQARVELDGFRKRLAERRQLAATRNWKRMRKEANSNKNGKPKAEAG